MHKTKYCAACKTKTEWKQVRFVNGQPGLKCLTCGRVITTT